MLLSNRDLRGLKSGRVRNVRRILLVTLLLSLQSSSLILKSILLMILLVISVIQLVVKLLEKRIWVGSFDRTFPVGMPLLTPKNLPHYLVLIGVIYGHFWGVTSCRRPTHSCRLHHPIRSMMIIRLISIVLTARCRRTRNILIALICLRGCRINLRLLLPPHWDSFGSWRHLTGSLLIESLLLVVWCWPSCPSSRNVHTQAWPALFSLLSQRSVNWVAWRHWRLLYKSV